MSVVAEVVRVAASVAAVAGMIVLAAHARNFARFYLELMAPVALVVLRVVVGVRVAAGILLVRAGVWVGGGRALVGCFGKRKSSAE